MLSTCYVQQMLDGPKTSGPPEISEGFMRCDE